MERQEEPNEEEKKDTMHAMIGVLCEELSDDQAAAFDKVNKGVNVFITGYGGTGKSYLIAKFRELARIKHKSILVMAMTGVAAKNIEGETLHSATGIKLGQEDAARIVTRIKYNPDPTTLLNWTQSDIWVIDEVSMMDGDLLAKLDTIGRHIKGNLDAPFGGIQLVFTGDFLQLGPIMKRDEHKPLVFQTALWRSIFPKENIVMLKTCHRQKEEKLRKALGNIREGRIDAFTTNYISSLSRPIDCPKGIVPTKLFCVNEDVESSNTKAIAVLPGELHQYKARDIVHSTDPKYKPNFDELFNAPEVLNLKIGAQVMCLRNLRDKGLVNGSVGVVIDFVEHEKSYVPVPLVKFFIPEGDDVREMEVAMEPIYFDHEKNNVKLCSRRQVPLALAWAISVHKAQGLTLDYMEAHIGRAFAEGQVYVALSRATTSDGLRVVGFEQWRVKTNKLAKTFYDNL